MKVILLKDTPGLGNRHEVKDVSSGYARNFLIPRGLAELATENRIKSVEIKRKRAEEEKKITEDILEKNMAALDGLKISIEEKANEKGHLFAGVNREEISKILKEQKHVEIPAEMIQLEQPIKEAGEHKILVHGLGEKTKDREFVLEIKAK